ncbi:hypothetical protein EON67_11070, partial [archaeon]
MAYHGGSHPPPTRERARRACARAHTATPLLPALRTLQDGKPFQVTGDASMPIVEYVHVHVRVCARARLRPASLHARVRLPHSHHGASHRLVPVCRRGVYEVVGLVQADNVLQYVRAPARRRVATGDRRAHACSRCTRGSLLATLVPMRCRRTTACCRPRLTWRTTTGWWRSPT